MKLPINWFDIAVLIVLAVGVQRGRKHGMSEELMPVMKWLAILIGGAFGYAVIGEVINSNTVFERLSSYLMAYFAIMLVTAVAFAGIKKLIGGKLIGSDVFGRGEYYLGMVAGIVRYACILLVALAFLHARSYTQGEIKADVKYQNDVFGSTYFPKLYTVQTQVFEKSFLGPHIVSNLGFLLIKSTPPENKKQFKQKQFEVPQ